MPEHRVVWAGCAPSAGGVVFGYDEDRAIEMSDTFGGSQVSNNTLSCLSPRQDFGDCRILEELADQKRTPCWCSPGAGAQR